MKNTLKIIGITILITTLYSCNKSLSHKDVLYDKNGNIYTITYGIGYDQYKLTKINVNDSISNYIKSKK